MPKWPVERPADRPVVRRAKRAARAAVPQVGPALLAAFVAAAVHLGALPVECLSGVLRDVAVSAKSGSL